MKIQGKKWEKRTVGHSGPPAGQAESKKTPQQERSQRLFELFELQLGDVRAGVDEHGGSADGQL